MGHWGRGMHGGGMTRIRSGVDTMSKSGMMG